MTVTIPLNPQRRRLYPSHLEKFQQCRRRYSLQMEERRPSQARVALALTKGNVAHEVLKICGNRMAGIREYAGGFAVARGSPAPPR